MTFYTERENFEAAKADVMARYLPSHSGNLQGMLVDFDHYLRESDILVFVSVMRTDDHANLIEAHCRTEGVSAFKGQYEAERIWVESLCYREFEAHIVSDTTFPENSKRLVLEFATVGLSSRVYVTGKIVVDMIRP